VNFETLLQAAGSNGSDEDLLDELARTALQCGEEERALPLLLASTRAGTSARLWQWTGLLQRALDEHEQARASFTIAANLAPQDASIAHGLARVTLEAGLDAVGMYERARHLAPTEGQVLLGLVAAKYAVGRGEEAAAELEAALGRAPLWGQGHADLAQLRSMLGQEEHSTAALEHALAAHPQELGLWTILWDIALKSEDYAALDKYLARAREAGQPPSAIVAWEAIAASEQGEIGRADHLFAELTPQSRATMHIWYIRHLLRSNRVQEAVSLIDEGLNGEAAVTLWPYASIAWRLTDDPRWRWLEGDHRLITVADLSADLPPLDDLADLLRSLHVSHGEYLGQSVRGGTQSDGPLFSRIDPTLRQLRAAATSAVQRYVAQLPPPDPDHPLLKFRRDRRIRFAGSWSVRLRESGYHSDHVHPQGWISSALYVALPLHTEGDLPHAGWLKIGGAPAELRVNVPPARLIEPKIGQLVLFPSWMWHGTVPFSHGERLTVAFDVRPPHP
jgi:tetratricopeptide (TPR) repeat protein